MREEQPPHSAEKVNGSSSAANGGLLSQNGQAAAHEGGKKTEVPFPPVLTPSAPQINNSYLPLVCCVRPIKSNQMTHINTACLACEVCTLLEVASLACVEKQH